MHSSLEAQEYLTLCADMDSFLRLPWCTVITQDEQWVILMTFRKLPNFVVKADVPETHLYFDISFHFPTWVPVMKQDTLFYIKVTGFNSYEEFLLSSEGAMVEYL